MQKTVISMAIAAFASAGIAVATTQPYSGQEARDIASLSEADIEALLTGQGFGFAKAAELNGYPGPAHVLELADDLELNTEQRDMVTAVYDRMNEKARTLGAAFIEAEAALDTAFEDGSIDASSLRVLIDEASAIEAKLRATHLAAHLEVTPLLTRHQRVTYNTLRGYGDEHSGHGDGGH